jgi:Uma2 family endonuclease
MTATAIQSFPQQKSEEKRSYTIEEYLAKEERTDYKSEFHNGYIYPMPGGTYHHNLIASNIITNLTLELKN